MSIEQSPGLQLRVLGCGASAGVPLIGCRCPTCTSDNSKNNRTRTSVIFEQNGKRLLIDSGPDLRQQALRENISNIDAIAYTHAHADHTHGIDELRSFNYHANAVLPAYADAETLAELRARFGYAFEPPITQYGWFRPALEATEIDCEHWQPFHTAGMKVQPFEQWHGQSRTLGFKVGHIAYTTDANHLPERSIELLYNIDIWVVDCLRRSPAPTHAHLEMTLSWIEKVRPKHAILIHMAHDLEYDSLRKELPEHVEPAYDGMIVR